MQEKQPTWPDGTPKSTNNDFNLKLCPGNLAAAMRLFSVKAAAGSRGAQEQQAAREKRTA